jgi:outer membrane protein assembly factor BamB
MSQFKLKTTFNLLSFLVMLSLTILTVTGCSSQNTIPPEIDQYSAEWPLANMDYSNTRATGNSGITSQNIDELGLDWTFDIPGVGEWGASATNPLILDDTVYLQDLKSNVYAFELETGNLKWKKEYDLNNFGPNGPAVGWNKIFVIKGRYDIAALDIENGDEIWVTRLSDIESTGIDIQLVAYNNMVYASTVPGSSNADFYSGGGVGIIYALDQQTGISNGNSILSIPRISGVTLR